MAKFKFNKIILLILFIFLQSHIVHGQSIEDDDSKTILYYGWFFDESIAESLKTIYDNYLSELYSNVSHVESFLNDVSNKNQVEHPLLYYTKPLDPATGELDPYFHVTAKYCGDGIDCTEYATKVQPHLNKPFEMYLIGFYFTERTFGARILLTEAQRDIFDESVLLSLENDDDHHYCSEESNKIKRSLDYEEYPGIEFEEQEINFKPSQSKAHMTIGCAPNVTAVTTGYDLLEIVQFENTLGQNFHEFDLEDGILRQYYGAVADDTTEMAFVLYPHKRIVTTATFSPYYMPSSSSSTRTMTFIQSGINKSLIICTIIYFLSI